MSMYWIYVTDPSPHQITQQPMASNLIGQPLVDNKIFYALHDNKITLPSGNLDPDTKISWTYLPGLQSIRPDTSKHFHIFVGDLCPKLHPSQLYEAFAPFGEISECKIIQDPQTMNSRGYGFVSFIRKNDAESAIKSMNGQWLGSRPIRTNWAVRKKSTSVQTDGGQTKTLSFEDVYDQTSATNCTVYCGGVMTGLTEELLANTFSEFGSIVDIRLFRDKGYAFIRFDSKESATRAIVERHLTEVNGHIVKCSWGKKSDDSSMSSPPPPPPPHSALHSFHPPHPTPHPLPPPPSLLHPQSIAHLIASAALLPNSGLMHQTTPQTGYTSVALPSPDVSNQLQYVLWPENSPKIHDGTILQQQTYSLPIQLPSLAAVPLQQPVVSHCALAPPPAAAAPPPQGYVYSLGL